MKEKLWFLFKSRLVFFKGLTDHIGLFFQRNNISHWFCKTNFFLKLDFYLILWQLWDLWNFVFYFVFFSQEVLDEWVICQRSWMYLEPIFSSDDINRQLPVEGKRYQTMERIWRKIMNNVNGNNKVWFVFRLKIYVKLLLRLNEIFINLHFMKISFSR